MLQLNLQGLNDPGWKEQGITVPGYDVPAVQARTKETPTWIHFGAGNIFRAYIARLQHQLLEEGLVSGGILAAETFDGQVIDEIYRPYDNLTLLVTMCANGDLRYAIAAGIGASVKAVPAETSDWNQLCAAFESPTLQLCTMTVTEKGYSLRDLEGEYLPIVLRDLEAGPEDAAHVASVLTALLNRRFEAGGTPVAMVSMDNCSQNGDKLRSAVLEIACGWQKKGFLSDTFVAWLQDTGKVAFPLTMIDKITPSPIPAVFEQLKKKGVTGMDPVVTGKRTSIAPFANAESAEYLVIEDTFPNHRPPLEKIGVLFADRDTVNKSEKMKVSTCLNPLHTALAIFGHLLDIQTIDQEMRTPLLLAYAKRLGYVEGMPVVADPKIIDPRAFLTEVIEERFPNPYVHDTPLRVATDTSQNIGIRFGGTIRAYMERDDLDTEALVCIPLAIAGWCRYLMGVDDNGSPMTMSPETMHDELTAAMSGVKLGDMSTYHGDILPILKNQRIFGVDLFATELGNRIEGYFKEMIRGKGAVRKTLESALGAYNI